MKRLLLLCPTERERRDLPALAARCDVELVFDSFDDDYFDRVIADGGRSLPAFDLLERIERTIERARAIGVDGVTSAVGYPGMSAVAAICAPLGLPGPNLRAVLTCEHKYYCRQAQAQHVPEALARYRFLHRNIRDDEAQHFTFPAFLKPVKSCMSMRAFAVTDMDQLNRLLESAMLPDGFVEPFNRLVRHHTDWPHDASGLLLEELLHGQQLSVEGYCRQGVARVLGIVDAQMYPGTYSFQRFQYPSALPRTVQRQVTMLARRFIEAIDYGDAMFNIEMMWDPRNGRLSIIEVNPKIASQFPDLFEKVDGCSTYTTLMELALGRPVSFAHGRGRHRTAASCVLRTFADQRVTRIPTADDIARVHARFPDARVQILARPGRRLSEDLQDPHSYRYALINLGAQSEHELLERLEICRGMLPFEMSPCASS